MRCSQLSRTSSARQCASWALSSSRSERWRGEGEPERRTPTAAGTSAGSPSAGELDEPDAVGIRARRVLAPASRARRVLPAPPAPVSVSSRSRSSRRRDLRQLAVAADEARERDRQVVARAAGAACACAAGGRRVRLPARLAGSGVAAQQRAVELGGLRVGLGLELAPERLAQLVVLRERLLAAAGRREQAHQRAVRGLVERVDHHGLLEHLDRRRPCRRLR